MPRGRCRLLSCLLLLAFAHCAGGTAETLSIPAEQVSGSRMPERILAELVKPAGNGPFPAIILLHTCSGLSPLQQAWTARLVGWGYAVLIPNSFGSRGVYSVCAPANQPLVRPADRAGDVISAALWLRGQPQIDGDRIGVLGNSHGGATAAWVTQGQYERQYPGLLKASVDYYGPCLRPEAHGTVPLLVLTGEDDDWGYPAKTCGAMAARLKANQPFEMQVYPGVVHSFDNDRLLRRVTSEGHALEYDHAAAEDSFMRVKVFLDRYVRGSGSSARTIPTSSPKLAAMATAPSAIAGGP